MKKNQSFPIPVVKAAWIGITKDTSPKKGQWHNWINEIYIFFKRMT